MGVPGKGEGFPFQPCAGGFKEVSGAFPQKGNGYWKIFIVDFFYGAADYFIVRFEIFTAFCESRNTMNGKRPSLISLEAKTFYVL